jgi:hypothetical protein
MTYVRLLLRQVHAALPVVMFCDTNNVTIVTCTIQAILAVDKSPMVRSS